MKKIFFTALVLLVFASFGGCVEKYNPATGKSPTQEQVEAFVKEAVAFAKIYGQKEAFREFVDKNGQFWKGELYIYSYNYDGVCINHGAKPHLAGKNLIKLTDPNGVKLIEELRDLAKNGGGWLKFYWEHPQKKKSWPKMGYVLPVNDDWWLGSGYYLENN